MKIAQLVVFVAIIGAAVAQFQFCGSGSSYNATLAPHSTQAMFVWNQPGTKFDLNCVSVVPPSDSKVFVDVSVAYSPNHMAGPFAILGPVAQQYSLSTDVKFQYQTTGYFYLVASNMLDVSVTIQFNADATVSSSLPNGVASHLVPSRSKTPMDVAPRRNPAAMPTFTLCQKNYTATVNGRTAQNLMYWTMPAMTLTVICLEVSAAQQNPSSLDLWFACGPQATTGPVVKIMKLVAQAQPESSIHVECPIKGYFRLVAFNNDGTTANLQFGASGDVFLTNGEKHSGTATF